MFTFTMTTTSKLQRNRLKLVMAQFDHLSVCIESYSDKKFYIKKVPYSWFLTKEYKRKLFCLSIGSTSNEIKFTLQKYQSAVKRSLRLRILCRISKPNFNV